jgi:Protein of unknown function (DUF2934)
MAATISGVGNPKPLQNPLMSTLTLKQEEIAELAYSLYVQEGCQHGRDVEYWLRAEKQLGGRFFTEPAPAGVKAAKKPAPKKAVVAPVKKPVAKKAAEVPAKKAAKKKA